MRGFGALRKNLHAQNPLLSQVSTYLEEQDLKVFGLKSRKRKRVTCAQDDS